MSIELLEKYIDELVRSGALGRKSVDGLVMSYKPGEMFSIGRAGRYPDATEIDMVVKAARNVGLFLHYRPGCKIMRTETVQWAVYTWPLETMKL